MSKLITNKYIARGAFQLLNFPTCHAHFFVFSFRDRGEGGAGRARALPLLLMLEFIF